MKKILLLTCLGLTFYTTGCMGARLFETQGKVKSLIVENPHSKFKHSLVSYIPKSLTASEISSSSVVFFLHGGSSLNQSPSYVPNLKIIDGEFVNCVASIDPKCSLKYGFTQVDLYLELLKNFSEFHKVIIVMPGSNIGWNSDAAPLFKDLKYKIIEELNVDHDQFYLTGHSMGAMGAIRLVPYLKSDFRAFIALSGTLNKNQSTEEFVRQILGVPLYIINEEDPLYKNFLTQTAILTDYMDLLSLKYSIPNLTKMIIAHGNHNTVVHSLGKAFESARMGPSRVVVSNSTLESIHDEAKRLRRPSIPLPEHSKRVGNVTCGEFLGATKIDFGLFHSNKRLNINIKADREGLLNIATEKVEITFGPRLTAVELMTFDGSETFEFVKTLPKGLKALTRQDGEYLCILTLFNPPSLPFLPKGIIVTAGRSSEQALKKVITKFKEVSTD